MSSYPGGIVPRVDAEQAGSAAIWFGILGGPCAWFLHLLSAYIIAEFGRVGESPQPMTGGLTSVAWLLVAVTVLMVLAGLAALGVAFRVHRRATSNATAFGAHAGLAISGLATLFIVVESIPIFYYLRDC